MSAPRRYSRRTNHPPCRPSPGSCTPISRGTPLASFRRLGRISWALKHREGGIFPEARIAEAQLAEIKDASAIGHDDPGMLAGFAQTRRNGHAPTIMSALRSGVLGADDFHGRMLDPQKAAAMNRKLEAILDAGLLENVHQVDLYGSGGDGESHGDLLILQAPTNVMYDLFFARGKPWRRAAF